MVVAVEEVEEVEVEVVALVLGLEVEVGPAKVAMWGVLVFQHIFAL